MNKNVLRFLIPIVIAAVLYAHSYILHMFEKMNFDFISVLVMAIPVLIVFEIDRFVTLRYQKKNANNDGIFKLAIVPFLVSLGLSLIAVFSLYIPRKLYEINTVSIDTISIYHITSISIQVLIVVVMANTIHQIRFLVNKWHEASLKTSQLEKENVQAKFSVLKDQISPHFLFNNLNTLYGLIDDKPKEAKQYLKTLSTLYRQVLSHTTEEVITLNEELKNLNDYIYLIKIRFEDTIKTSIDLDNELLKMSLPPFALQMLVENAIKHNSFDKSNPLFINIKNEGNYILIENTLNPLVNKIEESGVGLKNIETRYSLLTNEKMEIIKTKNSFTVKIPLLKIT